MDPAFFDPRIAQIFTDYTDEKKSARIGVICGSKKISNPPITPITQIKEICENL
jgi:hypothetical protein